MSAATVDAMLPRSLLVKRGEIMAAFGLSRREFDAMVPQVFSPIPDLPLVRARFLRCEVIAVAQRWEHTAQPLPKV